jgi:hypothetical protein
MGDDAHCVPKKVPVPLSLAGARRPVHGPGQWALRSAAAPTWEVKRSRAPSDNNDERAVAPGSEATSTSAGPPHGGGTDEPREPGSPHLDAGEYDERGEASHKGAVKIA